MKSTSQIMSKSEKHNMLIQEYEEARNWVLVSGGAQWAKDWMKDIKDEMRENER